MRYRIGETGAYLPDQSSADIVLATVVFTLFVGILFVIAGLKGRQRWLQFWGGLTCICCAAYFARGWIAPGL